MATGKVSPTPWGPREFKALDDFIRLAAAEDSDWQKSRENHWEGKYTPSMWHFVRMCRFHPALEEIGPHQAANVVEASLNRLFGPEFDEPWDAVDNGYGTASWDGFVDLWHIVRRPVELDDPIAEAVRRADKICQIRRPKEAGRHSGSETYRRFLDIAYHLQRLLGDQDIALPVVRLGEELGVSRERVGQIRNNAIRDGYLTPVAPHQKPSGGAAGRAATYRFDLTRSPYSGS